MTADLDIYRSAAILVERYSEDAPDTAKMRADVLLEEGELCETSCESFAGGQQYSQLRGYGRSA